MRSGSSTQRNSGRSRRCSPHSDCPDHTGPQRVSSGSSGKRTMARVTVEDCLTKIPNRFQLVLAATYRARMLSQGHAPKIETKNKPGVTALREIAAGEVGIEMLRKVPV